MEAPNNIDQQPIDNLYQYGSELLLKKRKSEEEAKLLLQQKGISAYDAGVIIDSLTARMHDERKSRAKRDQLNGALCCAAGVLLSFANIGYLFLGAIAFGLFLLFRGFMNT